jgi:hypothetical protein
MRMQHRIGRQLAFAAGALAFSLPAFAQAPSQILSISFFSANVSVPLSDWLAPGMAILLAGTTMFILRRRKAARSRLFGALLILSAGIAFVATTGRSIFHEAQAVVVQPLLTLTTSPGTIDVAPQFPLSPLTVLVTNGTGRTIEITDIVLEAGIYAPNGGTCQVGMFLNPGGTCNVGLLAGGG